MSDALFRIQVPTVMLQRALEFYEGSPDGQYDYDVVVPLIKRELQSRQDRATAPSPVPVIFAHEDAGSGP